MYQLPLAVCSSFGAGNDGADVSTCPSGDFVIHYVEVPEFVDYQAAFLQFDPDVAGAVLGAAFVMFGVGFGVGMVIKVLRMRTRV